MPAAREIGREAQTVALAEGWVLWVWGCGVCGQLGLVDRDNRLVPMLLGTGEMLGGSLVHMAACGGCHTLVATEEGVVWAFGGGAINRLGLNDEDDRLVQTRVASQRFCGDQVATVSSGAYHSAQ
jgi:alpha-tubulin suppressor-like RCC1 family protein